MTDGTLPAASHKEGSEMTNNEAKKEVPPSGPTTRDAANWANLTPSLKLGEVPAEARNINVTGRRQTSPLQGFGKMWQKSYLVSLPGVEVTPEEVIATWKEEFQTFWPEGNHFYGPLTGIAPGDVALLNLSMPGKLKLSTGVLVLYADEESFTFMTPEGHMFAAFITFSAFKDKDENTAAKVHVLLRANDPIFEMGLAMGGHRKEDHFWTHTMTALASHFGVSEASIDTQVVCVDKRRQWRKAGNLRYNSALRSAAYMMATPIRAMRRKPPRP
jgi:hypothetical protein